MMRRIVFCLCCLCAAMAWAASPYKTGRVYIFSFSISITDSVAYLSEVQALDSVRLDAKKGFLTDRTLYTLQFDNYVRQTYGLANTTSAVFFADKKAKVEKRYDRVKRKYLADNAVILTLVGKEQFALKTETWDDEPETPAAKPEKATASTKKKKKK